MRRKYVKHKSANYFLKYVRHKLVDYFIKEIKEICEAQIS